MERNSVLVIFFIVILITIVAGLIMIRTLGSESVKCFANPGACFYNALVKNNPNTMIICYCSLSRGGSSIVLGLNESGEYLKEDNRQGMNNNFKMLNLSN